MSGVSAPGAPATSLNSRLHKRSVICCDRSSDPALASEVGNRRGDEA